MAATPITFAPFKYGQPLAVDSTSVPQWTGIVPEGQPHVLDFHEFLVIAHGRARIDINGVQSVVAGPTVFFTPPHVVRTVKIIDPLRLDLVVCSNKALRYGGWVAALPRIKAGAINVGEPSVVAALVLAAQRMQAELRAPRHDTGLLLDALLTQFLIALTRARAPGSEPSISPLVARFEALLERAFRLHHDVQYYADALAITADYLSSVTRSGRGVSAKAMLDRRIFREAARLLTQTTQPIALISASLGFDEPSHFSRFFMRVSGVAPGDYRRRTTNHGFRQTDSGN
jgi:AraC family transcriptional activator of pobA